MTEIKAILFDAGRVLLFPSSGHWFISPRFYEIVKKEIYKKIPKDKVELAFKKGIHYLSERILVSSLDEEFELFKHFYEIIGDELPELELSERDISELAEDLVYNCDKYSFYEDAKLVLAQLKYKYKIAIISDAWPSLEGVFKNSAYNSYIDTIVISSLLGVLKPHPLMYETALNEFKILPSEAIFIDDNLKNCIGAIELGIQGVLLCRNKCEYYLHKILSIGKKYKVIHNLEQVEEI